MEPKIGTGVDGNHHAACRHQLAFVGTQPYAMRDRKPIRKKSDLIELADQSVRILRISPFPLPLRLEKMHVDAPMLQRRGFCNAREQVVAAPLRCHRSVLDLKPRVWEFRDLVYPGQLLVNAITRDPTIESLEGVGANLSLERR